jgi:predicted DNA-binding transcriptional regulator YafY
MPANRNALIRYKVLDECLRNRRRKWTLELLVEKVSDALYEYEGMDKGISLRTIQGDLQMMRSDKLGYNAPIVVVDKKYYTYEDPNYSITNTPLTNHDMQVLNQAVAVLRQFRGFSHFDQLADVVQRLEDHLHAAQPGQFAIVDFERNDSLRGLAHLAPIHEAIIQQRALRLTYHSFKTTQGPRQAIFHAWWLKEYRNRWFCLGLEAGKNDLITLALDRIVELAPTDEVPYEPNEDQIRPEEFYRDVIGVTVSRVPVLTVQLWFRADNLPYVETKPLHPSQQVLERRPDGSAVVQINVQHNYELEREILGFGAGVEVLAPRQLRQSIQKRLTRAWARYQEGEAANAGQ